jgi:hypothetical protein
MFLSKSFFFFSRANKKILLQTGKGIPKVCGGKLKLDQFFFGGAVVVAGGDVCHYAIFWGRIRTCFPGKNCLFYETRKLKEEEEE